MKNIPLDKNITWTKEEQDKYNKLLEKLVNAGLYVDEVDEVIYGELSLEEALKLHNKNKYLYESLDTELKFVTADTKEDIQKILDICNEIAKERLEKGLY